MMDFIPGPNWIVPTPPTGDSTNRAASTQFVTQAIANATGSLPYAVSSTQFDFISGGVAVPANQDYRIVEFVPFPMTLNNFAVKLSTGLLTAILKVNAGTVTGSVINIGTTQITSALTAVNTATTGDVIILTVSGTANSPANLSFAVKFTRQLA